MQNMNYLRLISNRPGHPDFLYYPYIFDLYIFPLDVLLHVSVHLVRRVVTHKHTHTHKISKIFPQSLKLDIIKGAGRGSSNVGS